MMRCPSCNSFEWNSVERNIFGENILVQCRNCFTTYMTKWNPAYQPPKTVTQ
jgi:transcription elongation factor Elf1